MSDNTINMTAHYNFSDKQLEAINRAAIEPITPFGYVYVGCERGGRSSVHFSQLQWGGKKYASAAAAEGAREFPVYVAPQVENLMVDAFLAGIREAVPSRRPDLNDGTTKNARDAAAKYVARILDGAWHGLPNPYTPQHLCPQCLSAPCVCHRLGCGSQGG